MFLKGYTSEVWSWIFGASEKSTNHLAYDYFFLNWHNVSSYTKLEYASEYLECSVFYATKTVLFRAWQTLITECTHCMEIAVFILHNIILNFTLCVPHKEEHWMGLE